MSVHDLETKSKQHVVAFDLHVTQRDSKERFGLHRIESGFPLGLKYIVLPLFFLVILEFGWVNFSLQDDRFVRSGKKEK